MTSKLFPNRRAYHFRRRPPSSSVPPGEGAAGPQRTAVAGQGGKDIPLSAMLTGQSGTIQGLRGGRGFVGRLASLGFTPGAYVEMLQNYGTGPLIVEVRDTRIALGRGEARKVWVRLNQVSPEVGGEGNEG